MNKLTRRQFLQRAALTGAAVAAPWVVPARALGRESGTPAASNRIALGIIGVGKMAYEAHIPIMLSFKDVRIVALCDVDRNQLESGRRRLTETYGPLQGGAGYRDFRELLARPDIDAVCIATPDHWHAIIAIAAMRAGKDVYCEKPLTHDIEEAKAVAAAAVQFGRVTQVGSWQRSDAYFRHACELVRNGCIGRVHTVHANIGGPPKPCDLPPMPARPGLDWNFWLGPSPVRPFNYQLAPDHLADFWANWRSYIDFGGGMICDWGPHHMDIGMWGLGFDETGPSEIVPPPAPLEQGLTYHFADGTRMIQGGGKDGAGTEFVGERGRVRVNRSGYLETEPANLALTAFGPGDVRLYNSTDHYRDFLDCVRTRARGCNDFAIGANTAILCHLGNIAYRLRRPIRWDPAKREIIGDEEARRLMGRPMRAPWSLVA